MSEVAEKGFQCNSFQPRVSYVLSLSGTKGGGSYGCGHIIRYQELETTALHLHPSIHLSGCVLTEKNSGRCLCYLLLFLCYVHGCVRMCGWVCVCVHTKRKWASGVCLTSGLCDMTSKL